MGMLNVECYHFLQVTNHVGGTLEGTFTANISWYFFIFFSSPLKKIRVQHKNLNNASIKAFTDLQ